MLMNNNGLSMGPIATYENKIESMNQNFARRQGGEEGQINKLRQLIEHNQMKS